MKINFTFYKFITDLLQLLLKNYNYIICFLTVYIQSHNAPYGSYVVEDISQHSNKVSYFLFYYLLQLALGLTSLFYYLIFIG